MPTKKTSNTLLYILIATVILCIGIFYYFKQMAYTISEITADNYSYLMKEEMNQSISGNSGLHVLFENPILFSDPKNITSVTGYIIQKSVYNSDYFIKMYNESSHNEYTFRYPDEKSNTLQYVGILNTNGIPNAGEIIQKLLQKEEYTLKETEKKYGYDILIKDVGDFFIISQIYKSDTIISGFGFHLYKKNKYFK